MIAPAEGNPCCLRRMPSKRKNISHGAHREAQR